MFAVHAAEQQYRHDTWMRDRERRIIDAIRDRTTAVAAHPTTPVLAGAGRPPRATWARPIGVRTSQESAAVCAVA